MTLQAQIKWVKNMTDFKKEVAMARLRSDATPAATALGCALASYTRNVARFTSAGQDARSRNRAKRDATRDHEAIMRAAQRLDDRLAALESLAHHPGGLTVDTVRRRKR